MKSCNFEGDIAYHLVCSDGDVDVASGVRSDVDLLLVDALFPPFADRWCVVGRSHESAGQKSIEANVFNATLGSANTDVGNDVSCGMGF